MPDKPGICVACGKSIPKGKSVLAYYADKEQHTDRTSFELHEKCFKDGETVTSGYWEGADEKGDPLFHEETITRYVRVKE